MHRSGFILKDYLLSLLIVMILFPIISACFSAVSKVELVDNELQDILSINQLRDRLIYADNFKIEGNDVIFMYKGKETKLRYSEHKLYMFPGYLLYLSDIDDLSFYIEASTLMIVYYKDGNLYNYALCKI